MSEFLQVVVEVLAMAGVVLAWIFLVLLVVGLIGLFLHKGWY